MKLFVFFSPRYSFPSLINHRQIFYFFSVDQCSGFGIVIDIKSKNIAKIKSGRIYGPSFPNKALEIIFKKFFCKKEDNKRLKFHCGNVTDIDS